MTFWRFGKFSLVPGALLLSLALLVSWQGRAEESAWTASMTSKDGVFAVRVEGPHLLVLRADDRAGRSPQLRARILGGKSEVIVPLRFVESEHAPWKFLGEARASDLPVTKLELETSGDGHGWRSVGVMRLEGR